MAGTSAGNLRASAGWREPSKTAGDRCGAFREAGKRLTATESPERVGEISKHQPAQMVSPEQVFPGTATNLASKDAGGSKGSRIR
jgi:hypothetical protein